MKITRLLLMAFILATLMGCSLETDVFSEINSSPEQIGSQSNHHGADIYTDPIVVEQGDSACLEISYESIYSDPDGTVFSCEPKSTIKVFAPQDTVYAKDYDSMMNILENFSSSSSEENNDFTTKIIMQKFGIGNQNRLDITFDMSYEIYHHQNSQNLTVEMPYVKVNKTECQSVGAEQETNGITPVLMSSGSSARHAPYMADDATQHEIYEVSALFDVELEGVGLQPITKNIVFDIRFVVVVGAPKLVAINYRKGYEWFEPHDNIPLTYQYIVYRDSVFSDGSVHTMESRSGKTAMESAVYNTSHHGKYGQAAEVVNGTTIYYFADRVELDDNAYRNFKSSRKIAVPNISLVTWEPDEWEIADPDMWSRYSGYNPNSPQIGWYWSLFFHRRNAYICYDYAGYEGNGGIIAAFDIASRWYNHILYVKDSLNGGQLIDFLGDENDIDDTDYRAQFDFNITEENTTMPTGEPAKVFTHKCITTMLGRQFHYEIVDTVYQYTTPPF